MKSLWLGAALVLAAACGGHHGDDDDTTGATLLIDPPTSEVLIENGAPAKQAYTATIRYADGAERDVTDQTSFTIDENFGVFQGPVVQVGTAGKTQVFGGYKDIIGNAELIARVKSRRVDPSLPPNTGDLFDGPEDAARAPTVVYPALDVVMPRNLGDFETHWIDTHGNDVFEVSLKTEFADVRVYVPGGNGVAAAGPMASFSAFEATEWLSAVGNEQTVAYQVRGIQKANPTTVGADSPRLVRLSNQTLEGGLYYWAAANTSGAYGIFRHDMAKPGLPAEEFMTTNQTKSAAYPNGRCVACHTLSRDGTKMAITFDGGDGAATTVDVATKAAAPSGGAWNFATYTPDGSQLVTVSKGTISVRDAATQAVITNMPSTGYVSHPDMSPDGARIVYIRDPGAGPDWSFNGGHIFVRSYDGVTHTFGAEQPLVTDGVNNFYPSWSPDGNFILFNRADNGASYNNGNATLYVIKADGSGAPIQLAKANLGGGLTNSWGRWAPFDSTVGANNAKIFWVTVSSKRDFGTRLVGAGRPQIWMTPFFVDQASAGMDPSVAAFRLPFQDITSNNHIAQWTERVVVTQ